MKRVYYPYSEFVEDLKALVSKIDIEFDTIIGVARGGLTISHLLGEYYNIRRVFSINSIGYDDSERLDSIDIFNTPELSGSSRVLIVDDIVDSGDTLNGVLELLEDRYPNIEIYTASIFYKRGAVVKPNFYLREPDGWVDFFWSCDLG